MYFVESGPYLSNLHQYFVDQPDTPRRFAWMSMPRGTDGIPRDVPASNFPVTKEEYLFCRRGIRLVTASPEEKIDRFTYDRRWWRSEFKNPYQVAFEEDGTLPHFCDLQILMYFFPLPFLLAQYAPANHPFPYAFGFRAPTRITAEDALRSLVTQDFEEVD